MFVKGRPQLTPKLKGDCHLFGQILDNNTLPTPYKIMDNLPTNYRNVSRKFLLFYKLSIVVQMYWWSRIILHTNIIMLLLLDYSFSFIVNWIDRYLNHGMFYPCSYTRMITPVKRQNEELIAWTQWELSLVGSIIYVESSKAIILEMLVSVHHMSNQHEQRSSTVFVYRCGSCPI